MIRIPFLSFFLTQQHSFLFFIIPCMVSSFQNHFLSLSPHPLLFVSNVVIILHRKSVMLFAQILTLKMFIEIIIILCLVCLSDTLFAKTCHGRLLRPFVLCLLDWSWFRWNLMTMFDAASILVVFLISFLYWCRALSFTLLEFVLILDSTWNERREKVSSSDHSLSFGMIVAADSPSISMGSLTGSWTARHVVFEWNEIRKSEKNE